MHPTIGTTGLLAVGVAGALLSAGPALWMLRSRSAATPSSPPPPPATPTSGEPGGGPPPVTGQSNPQPFRAWERRADLSSLVVIAIEGAIGFEVVRWLDTAHVHIGIVVLIAIAAWIGALAPSWLRRVEAHATRVIPATPSEIWAVLVEEVNPRSWSPRIRSVEQINGSGPGLGSTYRQVQQLPSGPVLVAHKVVTVFDRERHYELRYTDLWQPQVERYAIEPAASGSRITYRHDGFIGPFTAIAGGILLRTGMRERVRTSCEEALVRVERCVASAPLPDAAGPATNTVDGAAITRPGARSLRVGVLIMAATAGVSLGGYALVFGLALGALTMAVLVIHELGHYAEARRHGQSVRLPFFLPFVGAAVTLRTMPGDAVTHARIALAGPLCGTLAIAVSFLVAAPTHSQGLLLFAQVGALLNLANVIPIGILDGGAILAPISRWISVVGLLLGVLLIANALLFNLFSPLLVVIAGLAVFSVVTRFRRHRTTYYQGVSRRTQVAIGLSWLALSLYLLVAGTASLIALATS